MFRIVLNERRFFSFKKQTRFQKNIQMENCDACASSFWTIQFEKRFFLFFSFRTFVFVIWCIGLNHIERIRLTNMKFLFRFSFFYFYFYCSASFDFLQSYYVCEKFYDKSQKKKKHKYFSYSFSFFVFVTKYKVLCCNFIRNRFHKINKLLSRLFYWR